MSLEAKIKMNKLKQLQFGKKDMKRMISYSSVGIGIGMIYAITTSVIKNYTNGEKLYIETEAIGQDPVLYSLFTQLQHSSHIDEPSFRGAVINVDKLVFLHQQIYFKYIEPNLSDRNHAYFLYKTALSKLEFLVNRAKKTESAKTAAEVHVLYCNIFDHLTTKHWEEILRLTQV